MFDIGGWEFLIIIVVAIIIVGPKDLPGVLRTVTSWVRKMRSMSQEFRSTIDDLADEVELESINTDLQRDLEIDNSDDLFDATDTKLEELINPKIEDQKLVNKKHLDRNNLESEQRYPDKTSVSTNEQGTKVNPRAGVSKPDEGKEN
ncbi:MAG: twin-arginine translocase subunit TatB [Rhodospirillales bacterium]|nr:twin-arginine translocase subunit TatB [Rhodospirillales bacterium]|tara:strand:+ start:7183 stop:7623 length:441 start_codon:yes stop_codon:yes gene_type:complete